MSARDLIGLLASYLYAFGLLRAAESIRTWRGWKQDFTRKLVHIGAGLWVWAVLYLFDHWCIGIIPFATFIVLNYLFYRRQTFKAMDSSESTPGTVYFAFSITLLFALFWRTGGPPDRSPIAVAATMAMTLGDALAAIVGGAWGRRAYHPLGRGKRTWLGTATMALVSLASIGVTLLVLPGSALSPHSTPLSLVGVLGLALSGALVATVAEALSPAGTDNLTVPLSTGAVLYLLSL